MTDNVSAPITSGTTIATDEIGGVHYQKLKLNYGPDDTATPVTSTSGLPVNLLNTTVAVIAPASAVPTATFNRPANTTAYASGDLVADVTTTSITPMAIQAARVNAGTGAIRRVRLSTNKTGLSGSDAFRVHFFKNAPTVASGDNGVFSPNGIGAVHLGYCDVTLDRIFSDGAKGIGTPSVGGEIIFDAGAGTQNIFALLEVRGAYTPNSGETFTLAVEVLRD